VPVPFLLWVDHALTSMACFGTAFADHSSMMRERACYCACRSQSSTQPHAENRRDALRQQSKAAVTMHTKMHHTGESSGILVRLDTLRHGNATLRRDCQRSETAQPGQGCYGTAVTCCSSRLLHKRLRAALCTHGEVAQHEKRTKTPTTFLSRLNTQI
jgi:hypothetical protein